MCIRTGRVDLLRNAVGDRVDAADSTGTTAIHLAATLDETACVRWLVREAGARVDLLDALGRTALDCAVLCGSLGAAAVLMTARAPAAVELPVALLGRRSRCRAAVVALLRVRGRAWRDVMGLVARQVWDYRYHEAAYCHNEPADARGRTPLMLAVYCSDSAWNVRVLVARGAAVDAVDATGSTALHWAAVQGHARALRALIEHGASAAIRDKDGASALELARFHGHVHCEQVLLAVDWDAAFSAAYEQRLLAHLHTYADRGAWAAAQRRREDGWTLLHIAAYYGQVDASRALVELGADVNALTHDGRSPAEYASESLGCHPPVLELLCAAGATRPLDWNAMAAAAERHCLSAYLHDHVPRSRWRDVHPEYGTCVLALASAHGDGTAVVLLLNAGVDVNARNVSGQTALHSACTMNHPTIVQLLCAAGADVNVVDVHGVHVADAAHFLDCVRVLMANGASSANPLYCKMRRGARRCRSVALTILALKRYRGVWKVLDRFVVGFCAIQVWASREDERWQ